MAYRLPFCFFETVGHSPRFYRPFKGAAILVRGFHVRYKKRHASHDHIPAQSSEVHEASQKDQKPLILTINGKAEAVVQDAEAYQRLLDIAAQTDAQEGIGQGMEDLKKGRVRPARQALEMFPRNHAVPR